MIIGELIMCVCGRLIVKDSIEFLSCENDIVFLDSGYSHSYLCFCLLLLQAILGIHPIHDLDIRSNSCILKNQKFKCTTRNGKYS